MNWNTKTKAIDELEQCISSLELAELLIPALSAQDEFQRQAQEK